jgi:BirA family biotin operon repressor/biotin-[acetyl-CoA-carboxylase] ligase
MSSCQPRPNAVPNSVPNSVIDECESTNDLVRRLAESGAPQGTWISARRQVGGRGRLGRKWEGIEGNLFLSMVARVSPMERWSWVPMATAIAVAECLAEFNPKLDVQIKWPNDLWLDGAKLGGILCEASGGAAHSYIVIGLGLNCTRAPEGLDQAATSLTEFLSRNGARVEVTADEIRMPLVSAITSILGDLQTQGPESLLARYNCRSVLKPGSVIEWHSEGKTNQGTVEGVGPAGELQIRDSNGKSVKLYAEDVKVRPMN